jgi:EamA domain-containing membrane protein RarD
LVNGKTASVWRISVTIKRSQITDMKQHEVTVLQIGLIAGTRAMLGAGIALLLSEKLSDEQRRAIGWTLVAVGAVTTIPLVLQLLTDDE